MIKSTIAVMASLMLVACGEGEAPIDAKPDGQQASQAASTKVDSDQVASDQIDSDQIIPQKPGTVQRAPTPAAAADDLTLTYFNLAG
jgi:hypothetical protein